MHINLRDRPEPLLEAYIDKEQIEHNNLELSKKQAEQFEAWKNEMQELAEKFHVELVKYDLIM